MPTTALPPIRIAAPLLCAGVLPLLSSGCEAEAVELVQEIAAARGECTRELLERGDEECVRMMERYTEMGTDLVHTYIGGLRTLDQALDRMPPPDFDTGELGFAISPELRNGGPFRSEAIPGRPANHVTPASAGIVHPVQPRSDRGTGSYPLDLHAPGASRAPGPAGWIERGSGPRVQSDAGSRAWRGDLQEGRIRRRGRGAGEYRDRFGYGGYGYGGRGGWGGASRAGYGVSDSGRYGYFGGWSRYFESSPYGYFYDSPYRHGYDSGYGYGYRPAYPYGSGYGYDSGYGYSSDYGYGADYGDDPDYGYGSRYGYEPRDDYGRGYRYGPEYGYGGAYGFDPRDAYGRNGGYGPNDPYGGDYDDPGHYGTPSDIGPGYGYAPDAYAREPRPRQDDMPRADSVLLPYAEDADGGGSAEFTPIPTHPAPHRPGILLPPEERLRRPWLDD